jgi:hypothetical protein
LSEGIDLGKFRMKNKSCFENNATETLFARIVDVNDFTIPKNVLKNKMSSLQDIVREYSTYTLEKDEEI